eukprot:g5721.t1
MYRMEERSFDKLADLLRPVLERKDFYARERSRNGAVPVEIRLAVALRILAGASHLNVAILFGIALESVFHVLREVVDAINNTPEVGPSFPQTVKECARRAKEWEVQRPAKFKNRGSLGSAVGGGGLAHSPSKRPVVPQLPGITGNAPSAAATTQSKGEAARLRSTARTAPDPSGKGKGKQRADHAQQVAAALADPDFESDNEHGSSDGGSIVVDDSHYRTSGDESEGDDLTDKPSSGLGRNLGGASSSGAASSTAVDKATKDRQQLQASLNRHKGKPYGMWKAYLLKEACGLRRITGFSRSKDVERMVAALEALDKVMCRSSPYIADLEDKAAGGTPASKPPASEAEAHNVPEHLKIGLKAAIASGVHPDPKKMYDAEGKSYSTATILAAIERDVEDGLDDNATEGTANRRKSKHCIPRFCELLMHEDFRGRFAASRTQLKRKELDSKQTSNTRDIHIDLWEAFKNEDFKVVSSFADDVNIVGAGIDPNVVHQPDITFQKFTTMRNDILKDHGDMYVNFKKSGSNGEMYSFCKGSLDTYYFGLTAEKCPDILAVCDQMLPEGTARENTGVGSAGDGETGTRGAAADAAKRRATKAQSKERNSSISGLEKKKKRQEEHIEKTAKVALSAVKGELGLEALFGGSSSHTYADAPTSFYDTKEGCESKAAKLDYQAKLRKELSAIKADIAREKELGEAGDHEDLDILQRQADSVRAQLKEAIKEIA